MSSCLTAALRVQPDTKRCPGCASRPEQGSIFLLIVNSLFAKETVKGVTSGCRAPLMVLPVILTAERILLSAITVH